MKIILRADVENLGRLGDVVAVKPGYGRNYLVPQGLAMVANPSNLKVFERERKKLETRMDALRTTARDLRSQIEALTLVITMRVGENDKLYGSVTNTLIAEALVVQGLEVDRRRILLDAPIRSLGEHAVRVRLHADVTAVCKVRVASEERHYEEDRPPAQEPAPDADTPAA